MPTPWPQPWPLITNCGVPFSAGGVKPAGCVPNSEGGEQQDEKDRSAEDHHGRAFRLAQVLPSLTEP